MAMASLTLILAASVGIHAGHDRARGDCRECGEVDAAVREKVATLRTACLWVVRRKAARQLRGYDWERHPEAVEALADAVLHDRQCLVRQEAAESLGKMKPCLPAAHEALARAAEDDPSLIARCAAKKALKSVGQACVKPCDVCGPSASDVEEGIPPLSEPGESIIPPPPETLLEPLAPTSLRVPIVPATPSPFTPVETDATLPPPRRVQRPLARPEDAEPLVAPIAPIDRYDPIPSPPPTPLDIPAPRPGWPR